jgi:hypothetical protein
MKNQAAKTSLKWAPTKAAHSRTNEPVLPAQPFLRPRLADFVIAGDEIYQHLESKKFANLLASDEQIHLKPLRQKEPHSHAPQETVRPRIRPRCNTPAPASTRSSSSLTTSSLSPNPRNSSTCWKAAGHSSISTRRNHDYQPQHRTVDPRASQRRLRLSRQSAQVFDPARSIVKPPDVRISNQGVLSCFENIKKLPSASCATTKCRM